MEVGKKKKVVLFGNSLSNNKSFIFVYGTLMTGFKRRKYLEKYGGVKTIAKAHVSGYKLIQEKGKDFPIAIYSSLKTDVLKGEIIEVTDKVKKEIQGIESEYVEKLCSIEIQIEHISEEYFSPLICSIYVLPFHLNEKLIDSVRYGEAEVIKINYKLYAQKNINSILV